MSLSEWKLFNCPDNTFKDYYNKLLALLSRHLILTTQPTCSSTSYMAEVNTGNQGRVRGRGGRGRGQGRGGRSFQVMGPPNHQNPY